ncbi:hypothetical protein ATK74_0845 [Propionicimonas paludicola]|uniref:Uncharacterized protein n=1 Tax=Propionicimonas paludicola TaxID=185243 RepID=A0A2A9CQ43_9ACTN|nr:hypothetical protein [Propionicimonas paludicola]PFG16311.1 hypothetical protein ATK74_0845 [Propionicimonas paludicola]
MSQKLKLAGKLPGNEMINGLDPLAEQLAARWNDSDAENPAAVLVIGIMRVRKLEVVAGDDGRQHVPTLELSRVEPLGVLGAENIDGLGLASVEHQKILLRAAEARTGDTPLPIDAESVDDAQITVIGDGVEGGAQVLEFGRGGE